MKKTQTTRLITFAISFIIIFSACKKHDEADLTPEYTKQTDDQLMISAEIDMVANDANTAVDSTSSFFKKMSNTSPLICDGKFA
jgi:hypothetical protein